MCKCTPGTREPFCGKGACVWPTGVRTIFAPRSMKREFDLSFKKQFGWDFEALLKTATARAKHIREIAEREHPRLPYLIVPIMTEADIIAAYLLKNLSLVASVEWQNNDTEIRVTPLSPRARISAPEG